MPIPAIVPQLGQLNSTSNDSGDLKGTASIDGRGSTPLRRGKIAPLATNATKFLLANCWRNQSASSIVSTCFCISAGLRDL